jgi:hypothetical protein
MHRAQKALHGSGAQNASHLENPLPNGPDEGIVSLPRPARGPLQAGGWGGGGGGGEGGGDGVSHSQQDKTLFSPDYFSVHLLNVFKEIWRPGTSVSAIPCDIRGPNAPSPPTPSPDSLTTSGSGSASAFSEGPLGISPYTESIKASPSGANRRWLPAAPECSLDVPECSLNLPNCSLNIPKWSLDLPDWKRAFAKRMGALDKGIEEWESGGKPFTPAKSVRRHATAMVEEALIWWLLPLCLWDIRVRARQDPFESSRKEHKRGLALRGALSRAKRKMMWASLETSKQAPLFEGDCKVEIEDLCERNSSHTITPLSQCQRDALGVRSAIVDELATSDINIRIRNLPNSYYLCLYTQSSIIHRASCCIQSLALSPNVSYCIQTDIIGDCI